MTELDRLRQQRKTLDRQIAEEERHELASSLRRSFATLVQNESMPVTAIVEQALTEWRNGRSYTLSEFAQRLETAVTAEHDREPLR